jgi:hypothetical protein
MDLSIKESKMMKKFKLSLFLLFSLVVSGIGADEIDSLKLQKILDASGLAKQVIEIPGMVLSGMDQARKGNASITDSEYTAMKTAVGEAFNPADTIRHITTALQANLSQSDADQLLSWYESELGKKITKAEVDASTPDALNEMMANAQALFSDEVRVNLAMQIEELINTTDLMVQMQQKTGIAVFTAMSTALNPDQPVDMTQLKNQMKAQEQQMKENYYQLAILSFIYSYRTIEPQNIETYLAFLSEEDTKKFNAVVMQGFQESFSLSISKMAESLSAIMASSKKDQNI